jgi:hypothetical protein
MKKIIAYEIVCLLAFTVLAIAHNVVNLPSWYLSKILFAKCAYIGGIGGCLYCLRAVYLNRCVLKQWDDDWQVWYYLRPITSTIGGFVSCIFLRAGLLVLNASEQPEGLTYGYLAIAFIAGYNVDNFMKRIESIAKTAWGISKSRASSAPESDEEKGSKDA